MSGIKLCHSVKRHDNPLETGIRTLEVPDARCVIASASLTKCRAALFTSRLPPSQSHSLKTSLEPHRDAHFKARPVRASELGPSELQSSARQNKNRSLQRINLIYEADGKQAHATHVNPKRLHELHQPKLPSVALIESIHSKLPFYFLM